MSPDFLTSSVTDIGEPEPPPLSLLEGERLKATIERVWRAKKRNRKEQQAEVAGVRAMHPEKQAAVAVYAKAVEAKKDGPELLMATMNRAQRREFVAGARAHSKKLKRETLRDGNKLLRKLNAVAEARGL